MHGHRNLKSEKLFSCKSKMFGEAEEEKESLKRRYIDVKEERELLRKAYGEQRI